MIDRYPRAIGTTTLIYLTLVLMLLASGCTQSTPPVPTPSPIPANTETPIPSPTSTPTFTATATETPQPTDTATPTSTLTPNRTATQKVKATQTAEVVVQDIQAKLDKLEITVDDGYLGWYQKSPTTIDMSSYGEAYYDELDEDLKAADFIFKTDITWRSSGGLMTCGFIFRSEPNFEEGAHYEYDMIRLSGLPAWNIVFLEYGQFKANISGVRTSGAIDQGQQATNEIILVAEGEKFTLYINEERIGSFYDYSKRRLDGYMAFTAWQESGTSTCEFDHSWVWMLKE